MNAKTILITGASSGIGQATALLFQSRGWNVVATMRRPDAAGPLIGLERTSIEALDVTDAASIASAVRAGIQRFGAIDVVLNNAGYGLYGLLEATPAEKIRRQFETNVIGVLEVTRAIVPHFRARATGTIVNIASVGGKITFPLGALYHGSKFAVEGLSEALSYEMRCIGVHVKIIEPGMIATEFGGRSFDFNNDERLTAYQPLVRSLMSQLGALGASASPASSVAEVIFEAATDGSDRLRCVAGDDARALIAERQAAGEEAFVKMTATQYGL